MTPSQSTRLIDLADGWREGQQMQDQASHSPHPIASEETHAEADLPSVPPVSEVYQRTLRYFLASPSSKHLLIPDQSGIWLVDFRAGDCGHFKLVTTNPSWHPNRFNSSASACGIPPQHSKTGDSEDSIVTNGTSFPFRIVVKPVSLIIVVAREDTEEHRALPSE